MTRRRYTPIGKKMVCPYPDCKMIVSNRVRHNERWHKKGKKAPRFEPEEKMTIIPGTSVERRMS